MIKKRRFHIEITGKCNLCCQYCYNSKFNEKEEVDNELTLEEIKTLLKQAAEIGCTTYIFSGGEPFANKNIEKSVEIWYHV